MSATMLAAFIAVVAGYVAGMWFVVGRIDRRLERIEERLERIEVTLARIGQQLDDHITDHPGPAQRLVR